ncbi:hypothetical protein GCM10010168_50250 [Actinoplanes ianthinogenes]|uniref:Outer membrane channel protein CpnT-like N-terminal domain-containing protein n=1 Tax=Actinoplanes ianthinogenes TaxID=122358 RepID=A0ABN6CLY5_9ACTN|nr:hypothetical protein [Actinoplanes ianthinogenes]BCJ46077.1 hypothetical protein Aiant_67340 [Actinoplanes ianthinogenes]GGR26045.1 hypothetical protein GCM10010168_50250 [Actinoplanes ianthinogenes]
MAGSNGFGSWFDTVLDEFLEFFRECEQWVPIVGPVLEMLVDIPEGRELELYDLADAYGQAADVHRDHAEQVRILLSEMFDTWRGDGGAQKTQETLQKYLEQLNADAESYAQMQQMVQGAALSVEAAKMMDVVNLIMLAMATIEVIMTIIESFGLSAIGEGIAIATCRQAIKTALKELVEKLIGQGFKGAVKAIMKAGLKRGLQFVKFTVGTKLGIMGIQAAEGHDPMSHFDPIEFAGEVVDSFVVGFIGGPLSIGGHNPLTEGAAMALGQLGDNYLRLYRNDLFDAMNLTQWAQDHGLYVDRNNFDPLDGVATAGLFGGVLGAKGMREGMRNARADVRLGLGEKNALGEPGKLGAPEVAPRAAGETGSRSASDQRTGVEGSPETVGSERPAADQQARGGTEQRAAAEPGRQSEPAAADQRSEAGGAEQRSEPARVEQRAEAGGTEQRSEPGGTEQRSEPGGTEQRSEPGGTEQRSESGGADQRSEPTRAEQRSEPHQSEQRSEPSRADQRTESTGGEQRSGAGEPARADSGQTSGAPERASSAQEAASGSERGDQHQAAEPTRNGTERGPTGSPERTAEPGGAGDPARESTPAAGREPPVTTGARAESLVTAGAPAETGFSTHGQHGEAGGPRILEQTGQSAPGHPAAAEPVGARSGVPESGFSGREPARSGVPESGFSGREPARSGVPDMGFSRGGEPGRTDLPANRPPEGPSGEARGDSAGSDSRGGGSDRPARDNGPGREPSDGRTHERGERPPDRTENQDGPRRRSPEGEQRRWRDYSERLRRWAETRPGEQVATERALARRFGPGEGGSPRLTPEQVQRILDRPAEQLDATGQRFKQLVEENFTDPAFRDGQEIRRPSSPDDIAARLGELSTSRPPSLTDRLLHLDKLRDALPDLRRSVPEPELIHSEHVIGGEYHGFGRPADTVTVGREMRESVPEVLDRVFKGVEFRRPEGGGPDVLRAGEGRDVKVDFGAESMDRKHVGTSKQPRGGDVWQVRANSGTRPEHVSTVTSHEVAEILQTERLRAAGEPIPKKNMLNLKDTGARELSPDDHGRIAELLDWHERSVAGEPGAGDRLGELVDHLGLRGDGPRAVAGREAVTDLLDNPAAHQFNDAAAGRLSGLLKGDLPAAPEPRTFTEEDLRAIPEDLAKRLGIEVRPPNLLEGKVLQMEAHQQTLQKIRLHVEGDPVNTFRGENGQLQTHGPDGRTGFAANDPFRKPEGWDVVNSKQQLADFQHDAGHAKQIGDETTAYEGHAADLGTAAAERATRIQDVNSVLDVIGPRSTLPAERLAPITEGDLTSNNLDATLDRLRSIAAEHPELRPHLGPLEQSAKAWSTAHYDRGMASNRVGMIAGREFAMREFGISERDLTGGVLDKPRSGELDIWGLGRNQHGDPTLVVVEAKGGGAGTGGREHLQQGSGPYLERVMQLDPKFQEFLRAHPQTAEQIRSGQIKVEYYLVSQGHAVNGVVPDAQVYRFTFDGVDPRNIFDPRNIDAP